MKGRLTIFFSYANNTGKKEMLLFYAQKEIEKHRLVISLSPNISHANIPTILNIDKVIQQHPDLVLYDRLAYTNDDKARYHEVEELINQGISVYTTLNVYEIESLQDQIAMIIDTQKTHKIPDYIFDQADEVIFVDKDIQNDTKKTVLREIALRHLADRLTYRTHSFPVDDHILACLSSSPSNAKIIRTAARMANAFNSKFTALFIQTPEFQNISKEDKQRLYQNQKLARQLGATVETVFGDDIPFQIAEYARMSKVTKIILGQSATKERNFLHKQSFAKQLMSYAPHIDIHIIPDEMANQYHKKPKIRNDFVKNILTSTTILGIATLLSILFDHLNFTDSNIIMIYILGVLLTSIMTTQRIYSLVSSIASVFIFNFLFTEPRFSLLAYATGYPITFLVMFLTAYITGTFANRYKRQASIWAKNAYRTQILFDTNQLISKAKSKEEILDATSKQIVKLLGRNIFIFSTENNHLTSPIFYSNNNDLPPVMDRKEWDTSNWAFKNNHHAGATTDTMSDANYLYLAIRTNQTVYGVIGIDAKNNPLDSAENSILLSILGECALALENEKNLREKESAALLAQSEQLRANLLRMISHDLRTPLTSISGNANNLLNQADHFDEETKYSLYQDIYDDSVWLTNLVENLLFATRFEEGKMQLNTSPELLNDIVQEALARLKNRLMHHLLNYEENDELLLVQVDAKLIIQVILNIIDNAIKYTPKGSSITITTQKINNDASISIIDCGPGISHEAKQQIFDMFYTGENKTIDNRRSLGLGLYLCKSIIEAHHGTIKVTDNQPTGTIFTFTLPIKEVNIHE